MDNNPSEGSDKDGAERRNSNSEWSPTKCRITKPHPPKPATNPLQFVKVAPCPLFKKGQEQTKKVDDKRVQLVSVKDDAEEWQQNLANWKVSRRKRQEHIIERVVEVKKSAQKGMPRSKRRSKTFNEIVEDRNKRGQRPNIPILDDDSSDLRDFGIGGSSSKNISVMDDDTDDSSSCLDDKDPGTSDSQRATDAASSTSTQSQSEDELLKTTKFVIGSTKKFKPNNYKKTGKSTTIYRTIMNTPKTPIPEKPTFDICLKDVEYKETEYTYEGAIEDYRSRIKSKMNVGETIFNIKFDRNAAKPVAKVEVYKGKVSTTESPINMTYLDSDALKGLPEQFATSLSVQDTLKSLGKFTHLQKKSIEKSFHSGSVIKTLTTEGEKCNNLESSKIGNHKLPVQVLNIDNIDSPITVFFVDTNITKTNEDKLLEKCSSPDIKLNEFKKDCYLINPNIQSNIEDSSGVAIAPISMSSTEIIGLSSDREDSGVHTAEASCSVSQADESVEYNDMLPSELPNCIEKLQKEREIKLAQHVESSLTYKLKEKLGLSVENAELHNSGHNYVVNYNMKLPSTRAFLDDFTQHTYNDYSSKETKHVPINDNKQTNILCDSFLQDDLHSGSDQVESQSKPVIYENVAIRNYNSFFDDSLVTSAFPLAPPKTKEPPKEKPPLPPLDEDEKIKRINVRLDSAKRIKKEMHIKRSSFLGLDEPTADQIDPVMLIDAPPDINTFLQKESQLKRSLYQRYQYEGEPHLHKVSSQTSGLETEPGYLSSDAMSSSVGDFNTIPDGCPNSEQMNNRVTSEVDDIAQREREIIALVEKEELSKGANQYANSDISSLYCQMIQKDTKNEKFNAPYVPQKGQHYSSKEHDLEVLEVMHKLSQLGRQELAQPVKDKVTFKDNHDKQLQRNRYSFENIIDATQKSPQYNEVTRRKSTLELQNELNPGIDQKSQVIKQRVSRYYKPIEMDTEHSRSLPNIQQTYIGSINSSSAKEQLVPIANRKSMPELQKTLMLPYGSFSKQSVMPGKPLTSFIKEQHDKDKRLIATPLVAADSVHCQYSKPVIPIRRPELNMLSALPKHCNIPNCNLNQNLDIDHKHGLYQETELRGIAAQKMTTPKNNNQPAQEDKHISEPSFQTATQRVNHLSVFNDRNQYNKRFENKEVLHPPYMNPPHTVGYASAVSYPPLSTVENLEGKILSVSGKKKCSFCGNELGRGAAMIIESLTLFYHMSCFKCCVCHIELGDGLMGTDVRVRNQKLHCHNCYTSDDGVKFSCV